MRKEKKIIREIVKRGGLWGQIAARLPAKDYNAYIIECFAHCHAESVQEHFGKKLVLDIISYRLDLIRIPLKQLLEKGRITNER